MPVKKSLMALRRRPAPVGGGTLVAPSLTLTSATTDPTPEFTGNVTDPRVGDTLTLEWSSVSNFASTLGASANVLDPAEIGAAAVTFIVGTLADGTYYFRLRHSRPGWTDGVSATVTVTIAATPVAPVLSNAVDTQTSQTTATISADTDKANGTLYYVITTSTTQPSAAQIKAGQNEAGAAAIKAGSVLVTGLGTQTFDITGLTAATQYYTHFVHTSSGLLDSNRLSGDGFKTGLPDTYIVSASGGDQSLVLASANQDFATALAVGTAASNRRLTLGFRSTGTTAHTHSSVTLYPTATDRTNGTNGIPAAYRGATGQTAETASTNFVSHWDIDLPTGTSWVARLVTSVSVARSHMLAMTHSRAWSGNGMIKAGSSSIAALSGTIDVPQFGLTFAQSGCTSATAVTTTWAGATEQFDALSSGTSYVSSAFYANAGAAETARTTSSTYSAAVSNNRLLVGAYGASL